MFTLKKLSIEEGKDSLVQPGHVTIGDGLDLFKYDDPEARKSITSVQEVEEGYQILLTWAPGFRWHNTSKIKRIVSKEPGKVVFETQTSLYELTGSDD